ncbi:MAG TPA: hypothetical protein VL527_05425 [Dongiaceae bacterium]|jgi:hypothetical protein|nr:hypothetical protein [Dongiaceae bacterium]
MTPDPFVTWVKRQKWQGVVLNSIGAGFAFLGGILILFLTFWLAYLVMYIGMWGVAAIAEMGWHTKLHLSHEWKLGLSGVFLILLFIQHLRTSPWYWGDYPQADYVAAPVLQAGAGMFGGLVVMLAYPGASANMVADILLSGPRLCFGTIHLVRDIRRLAQMDVAGCAELLKILVPQQQYFTYEEWRRLGWEPWLTQLRSIDGVLFLEKGPSLSEELRQELLPLAAG